MIKRMAVAIVMSASLVTAPATAAPPNWTKPAGRIYAQQLSDETMKAHPELLSFTLHGVPPGAAPDTYTMFAGSYPDRIGNADDPDDIDVSKKGITIVDPRWHRTKDPSPKFVVLMPLRDAAGANIGLVVYAFKVKQESNAGERDYYLKSLVLRDSLAKRIASYAGLFAPVR